MGRHTWMAFTGNSAMELLCVIMFLGPTEWKTLSLVNQQNENKISARQDLDRLSEKIDSQEEIPPLIFYIIFLLAAGFIWLAPKL